MIAWLSPVVNDPRTERVIMALIVVNAVILGLETSKSVMASYGRLLEILDHIILAVFVIEIAARVIVHRFAFFRDPWSVFDFVVIGIALVPATETFSVLRSLRVLRALRLIPYALSLGGTTTTVCYPPQSTPGEWGGSATIRRRSPSC